MTTAAQQAALEKSVVREVYFCEFDFTGGISRMSTLNQNMTWGGFEWMGVGSIGDISSVNESESIESSALNFTLSIPSWIAVAAGSVEQYRGRSAKMWMCPLSENFQLIDTPVLCWRGTMDTMSTGIDGEDGKITLTCETSAYGLKRRQGLRMNAAQQKKRHPTDTGFDYIADLKARPSLWISVLFQKQ